MSDINDMIHFQEQVAAFLLARLNPELSRSMCCTNMWYTRNSLSPSLSLSYEVNASKAVPADLHENSNCLAVLAKGFAINDGADEGALIASSKYSGNNFSQVRPILLSNSSLLFSALCWVARFRRFRDALRSSPFRGFSNSIVVSKAIQQGRAHLSQEGHLSLASQYPCVVSKSILYGQPLLTFVHWWSPSSRSPSEV